MNAGLDYADGGVGRYYGRNTRTGFAADGYAAGATRHAPTGRWRICCAPRAFGLHSVDLTTLYSYASHTQESDALTAKGFPNDVLTYYQPNLGP